MSNLFKKAAMMTDIHFGLKSNSIIHNQDCEDFVDWFIAKAKAEGCETGFFLGDWHHHRASINLHTLNFSLRSLEKLNDAFDVFYFLPGNHDLYYRDKRDVHGVEWARHLPNIRLINDWFTEGDVSIVPWLVGDDHKKIKKLKSKYVLGHFELPHFKLNSMIEMPDHGEVKTEHFVSVERVFSGHFHMRQKKGNIEYIGNAFPHNYADDGDYNRGCMIIEWGQEPVYHNWENQPTYKVVNLSSLIDNADKILRPNMHVRVNLDIGISYEEANFIKETFIGKYDLREISLLAMRDQNNMDESEIDATAFRSVDHIITNQLTNIDSDFYDQKLLLEIYNNL